MIIIFFAVYNAKKHFDLLMIMSNHRVWNSTNFWHVPRNFNFYLVCFRIYMILTFSITSSFFKVLFKAKDKYPDFKYIDILNSQLQSFQLKFTERHENRLSSKTIKVLLSNRQLIMKINLFLMKWCLFYFLSYICI
jgi:hypothetical protein